MKRVLIIAAIVVVIVSAALANNQRLDGWVLCPVDYYPVWVCAADLDGDGNEDLITANIDADNISVIFGNGDGTFQDSVNYDVGDGPMTVAAADVDSDGDMDILVPYEANYGNDYIGVMLNDGSGNLAAPVAYQTYSDANEILYIDVDDDGIEDIVAPTYGLLEVLIGNGDGTFQSRLEYPCGSGYKYSVGADDFDGDGDIDVALPGYERDSLHIMHNDGTGAFTSYTNYPAGDAPMSLVVAELDGDAYKDIAVVCRLDNTISIYIANGDGTFADSVNYYVDYSPRTIKAYDIENDGDLDLVVGCWYTTKGVAVFRNAGDGTFGSPEYYDIDYSIGQVCVDFDKDGYLDLVAINNGETDGVNVLFNDGTGAFPAPAKFATGNQSMEIVTADMDGDSDPDIVVASYLTDNATVLINNGDSTFTGQNWSMGNGAISVAVADFDGVNGNDFVTANYLADSVSVQLNNGGGSFNALPTNYYVGDGPYCVAAANLDSDNYPDLVTTNENTDNISILFNNGDGTFGAAVNYAVNDRPRVVRVADLDDDGDNDLMVDNIGASTGTFSILLNDGSGNFSYGTAIDLMSWSENVWLYDMNDDTYPDMLISGSESGFYVKLNNGDATFQDTLVVYTRSGERGIFTADFDADGDMDVAFSQRYGCQVGILTNDGSGQLSVGYLYDLGLYTRSLHGADFDDDGDIDVVAVSSQQNGNVDSVHVFWNRSEDITVGVEDIFGPGQSLPEGFALAQNYPNPFNPSTVIEYALKERAPVTLSIYNVLGQKVRTLIDREQAAGEHRVIWDGRADSGSRVTTGVYFYQLRAGDVTESRKMVLLK